MVMLGQNAPTLSVQGPTSLRGRSQAIASDRVNRQTKGLFNNGRNLSNARRGTLRRHVRAEAPGQRHLVRFGAGRAVPNAKLSDREGSRAALQCGLSLPDHGLRPRGAVCRLMMENRREGGCSRDFGCARPNSYPAQNPKTGQITKISVTTIRSPEEMSGAKGGGILRRARCVRAFSFSISCRPWDRRDQTPRASAMPVGKPSILCVLFSAQYARIPSSPLRAAQFLRVCRSSLKS
jgi:hypothetical protein